MVEQLMPASSSYYRARYYDPITARFVSEDLLEFSGEDMNSCDYVGNGPLGSADPSGLTIVVVGDVQSFDQAIAYLKRDPGMAARRKGPR
jgi:RHS repeat-associated protein